tara:strand:- start:1796 stop:4162 length:2367 start_codon:yes stop_codon:yes gene_type:complete
MRNINLVLLQKYKIKLILILLILLLYTTFVHSENTLSNIPIDKPFAIIGKEGLSFTSTETLNIIQKEICDSDESLCSEQGEVISIIRGDILIKLRKNNPEIAKIIEINNEIQSSISSSGAILNKDLQLNEFGDIVSADIQFNKLVEIGLFTTYKGGSLVEVKNVRWIKKNKVSTFIFANKESRLKIDDSDFKDIRLRQGNEPSFVKMNNLGVIIEMDIVIGEEEINFFLGNREIKIPRHSKFKYLNNKIFLTLPNSHILSQVNFNNYREYKNFLIKGKNILLPTGDRLEGEILCSLKKCFSTMLDRTKINGVSLDSKILINFNGESESYSRRMINFRENSFDVHNLVKGSSLILYLDPNNKYLPNNLNKRIKLVMGYSVIDVSNREKNLLPKIEFFDKVNKLDLIIGNYKLSIDGSQVFSSIPRISTLDFSGVVVAYLDKKHNINRIIVRDGRLFVLKKISFSDPPYLEEYIDPPKKIKLKPISILLSSREAKRILYTHHSEINFFNFQGVSSISIQRLNKYLEEMGKKVPELKKSITSLVIYSEKEWKKHLRDKGVKPKPGLIIGGYTLGGTGIIFMPESQIKNERTLSHEAVHAFSLKKDVDDIKERILEIIRIKQDLGLFPPENIEKINIDDPRIPRELLADLRFSLEEKWGRVVNPKVYGSIVDCGTLKWRKDNTPLIPRHGFVRPYGACNLQEDVATLVSTFYNDPDFFVRNGLIIPGHKNYHPDYERKLSLALEHKIIEKSKYDKILQKAKEISDKISKLQEQKDTLKKKNPTKGLEGEIVR